MTKFRTGNHFFGVSAISEWKCNFCDRNEQERKPYIKRYFYIRPYILKLKELLIVTNGLLHQDLTAKSKALIWAFTKLEGLVVLFVIALFAIIHG